MRTDGQVARWKNMKLIVAFRNFANAPKKHSFCVLHEGVWENGDASLLMSM